MAPADPQYAAANRIQNPVNKTGRLARTSGPTRVGKLRLSKTRQHEQRAAKHQNIDEASEQIDT
jgi:hypothetical protein